MPRLIQVTSNGPMLLNVEHISAIFPKTPISGGDCHYASCIIMGTHTYYVLESVEAILLKIHEEPNL